MPHSSQDGKSQAVAIGRALLTRKDRVLDVGPGAGTYVRLLNDTGATFDCVEIFEPYVERYQLKRLYRNVYVQDIRQFTTPVPYDLMILGDILEHLNIADSQLLIARLSTLCRRALISIPWTYVQGVLEQNEAEIHLQPDLTPELMARRYPLLRPLYHGPIIGLYGWTAL